MDIADCPKSDLDVPTAVTKRDAKNASETALLKAYDQMVIIKDVPHLPGFCAVWDWTDVEFCTGVIW